MISRQALRFVKQDLLSPKILTPHCFNVSHRTNFKVAVKEKVCNILVSNELLIMNIFCCRLIRFTTKHCLQIFPRRRPEVFFRMLLKANSTICPRLCYPCLMRQKRGLRYWRRVQTEFFPRHRFLDYNFLPFKHFCCQFVTTRPDEPVNLREDVDSRLHIAPKSVWSMLQETVTRVPDRTGVLSLIN